MYVLLIVSIIGSDHLVTDIFPRTSSVKKSQKKKKNASPWWQNAKSCFFSIFSEASINSYYIQNISHTYFLRYNSVCFLNHFTSHILTSIYIVIWLLVLFLWCKCFSCFVCSNTKHIIFTAKECWVILDDNPVVLL